MEYLEYFPAGFSLQTGRVLLRPLQREDAGSFHSIAQPPELWMYFLKALNDERQLQEWMDKAVAQRAACERVPFTIIDKSTGSICGSTSYINISIYDKRIEIGDTWLGAPFVGSGINAHCKFALLQHAFETMLFERVEIKTDNLNERAKRAITKIGAIPEGILRSHMLMQHQRRRDTFYYSILKHEWPSVKKLDIFKPAQRQGEY